MYCDMSFNCVFGEALDSDEDILPSGESSVDEISEEVLSSGD